MLIYLCRTQKVNVADVVRGKALRFTSTYMALPSFPFLLFLGIITQNKHQLQGHKHGVVTVLSALSAPWYP